MLHEWFRLTQAWKLTLNALLSSMGAVALTAGVIFIYL